MCDMKRKMIFVPAGGLANRIRATLSAIALAEQTGIELKVTWFRDWALHAAFRDLFVPGRLPEGVRIVEASVMDLLVYDRPRQKNFRVPALFQKVMFRACLYEHQIDALRTQGFDFEEWVKQEGNVYMASYLPFYAYPDALLHEVFRPVPQVEEVIERRVSVFSAYTVGVHIRRTDNTLSIKHSPLELFFDCLDKEQAAHPDLCIYLATDSEEVKQAMRARYGERIVCAESKADRGSTAGIREGIADLWTLARTRKIYGSFHSSFSELAAEQGGIPLIVVKTENK